MIDWIIKFAGETATFNSIFGICLYWVPMAVCFIGYTMRTSRNIQKDKEERAKYKKEPDDKNYYTPTDTIGDLIGRGIVSVVPMCNLWAASFDVSPKLFGKFYSWIGKTFNQPIVPKIK